MVLPTRELPGVRLPHAGMSYKIAPDHTFARAQQRKHPAEATKNSLAAPEHLIHILLTINLFIENHASKFKKSNFLKIKN
jgi:hypothetical protein